MEKLDFELAATWLAWANLAIQNFGIRTIGLLLRTQAVKLTTGI